MRNSLHTLCCHTFGLRTGNPSSFKAVWNNDIDCILCIYTPIQICLSIKECNKAICITTSHRLSFYSMSRLNFLFSIMFHCQKRICHEVISFECLCISITLLLHVPRLFSFTFQHNYAFSNIRTCNNLVFDILPYRIMSYHISFG